MRLLALAPAALLLASCGAADAEPTYDPPPPPAVTEAPLESLAPEPTEPPSDDVPTEFPMDMEGISEPPKPGPNTLTITATSESDGTAHWGDIGSGNVTDIPAGETWTQTFEGVDAYDYWTVTVMGDFVSPNGDVSCSIEVDGEVVSEESASGQGASAYCSTV